jgi:chorismate mutase
VTRDRSSRRRSSACIKVEPERAGACEPCPLSESAPVASESHNVRLHALRGAISVRRNDAEAIVAATRELMAELMRRNEIEPEQIVSCIFSATGDLDAEFPAVAARDVGLSRVPLLCTREIDVPGALERVIRVLLHYYADDGHRAQHVYLGEAKKLRTDLDSAQ